jgi:antitoxin component YwqK of YwqJK toxin-antitoxin module
MACDYKLKKISKKYPDGTAAIVYDYPDKRDTLNYEMKIYFPTGKIQQELKVEKGKIVGAPIYFYPDGKISEIDSLMQPASIPANSWNGTMTCFYENGKISGRFIVKNGDVNGLTQHYNENGVLVKEYFVINDSIKNGEYNEFYPDGKLLRKATYSNDTLVGTEYIFKENGDTLKYNDYHNGRSSFPFKKWLDNGNVLEGNYLDGKHKAVLWRWYDKNGKEIRRKIAYPIKGAYVHPA